jgi:RHS repeat-associated protein
VIVFPIIMMSRLVAFNSAKGTKPSTPVALLISLCLFFFVTSARADQTGSVAGGWIDIGSGTTFFGTPEALCGPGIVSYEAGDQVTCCGPGTVSCDWHKYGVLAYACRPGYLPNGYLSETWEMAHLGAASGYGVAENGVVYLGVGRSGFCVSQAPPKVPFPPEGCAAGEGGFFACPGSTPFSPPPGGVAGPGQNDGPPGTDPGAAPPTEASGPDFGVGGQSCGAPRPAPVSALANPISAATGNKYQREVDYVGAGPLQLVRHYNSNLKGWVHNYAMRIRTDGATAIAVRPTGQTLVFTGSGAGAWSSNVTVVERLTRLAPATSADPMWQLVTADDTVELYNADGLPLSVTARGGMGVSMQYSSGVLQTVTDGFGRALQFQYDAQSRLAVVNAPGGQSATYAYGANGHLASVTYVDGKSRQYLYENPAFPYALTGIVYEAGVRYATWSYDAQGRAISSEHAGGVAHYTLAFDPSGLAVMVSDPLGAQRLLQHQNIAGRMIFAGSSQPCANCTGDAASNAISPTGKVTGRTDFAGVSDQYTYDEARNLPTSIIRASGRPESKATSITWHPTFRVPTMVTEAGRTTAYTYDNLGNKLTQTVTDTATSQARTWAWTYDSQGLATSMTDPKGGVWAYGYDNAGNRTSVRNPLGQQTSYSYDAGGRVTAQTDPNGLVTSYTYDLRGRLTNQSRGGEVTAYSYTPTGQLASATLPDSYQVSYSYDAADRLIAATDNRGATVQYTLDAMGNRVREEVKDATGNIALVTGRIINSLNKVAAIQGSVGQTTALAYDANGEPVAQTDPLNQTTRQALDGLRRPVATTFADNSSASQAWNQLDQLTQVTDPKGVQTRYQTNAFGEVTSETSPDIGTIAYTRDANGEVISMQDAKGQINRIERDALGHATLIEYAQGNSAFFSYDTGGYVSRVEDKSGSALYTRDHQGRVLTKIQSVNDNPSNPTRLKIGYTYEGGELASVAYPSGLKVFYRRSAGRITAIDVQEPPNPSGKGVAISPLVSNLTHTALGQPKSWTWKSGDSASRNFDADGRMTQSEIASYSWDAASRITHVTQTLWAEKTVTVVISGKSQTVTQLYQTPISWNAGYDVRNRLTSFIRAGSETRYSYDANSNRLTAVDTASSDIDLEAAFDAPNFTQSANQNLNIDAASNKLLGFSQTLTMTQAGSAISSVTSQVNYSLDANGAMISDGLRSFEYDESRRLSKVKILKDGEAAAVDYLHNALGQRVFKSEPQVEQTLPNEEELGQGFVNWLRKGFGWLFTQGNGSKASVGMSFVYDEDANLLGEYDSGSAQGKGRTEYVWLPTESGQAIPIGLYKNGKFYQVHSDYLGTPRLVTDSTNTAVWQWPYSAFGNNKTTGALATTAGSNGQVTLKGTKAPVAVNLRFPGQYFDDESNLNYNYFRSYQASQGRYSQPDPIGISGGLNRFSYVASNPLNDRDATGLDPIVWRSKTGPLYGNWGGKDWSGGQRPSENGGEMGSARPVDSIDFCAQQHDKCWDSADGKNMLCVPPMDASAKKDVCDPQFDRCLARLPDDPRKWPVPPTPGTEADATRFRNGGSLLGRHNFYRY